MRKGSVLILMLVLIATSITPLHGLAMETSVAQMKRCKCLLFTSSPVSQRQIKSIQVIPRGIRCQRPEIIVTTQNDLKLCVHHEARWVNKLLKQVTSRLRK